MTCDAAVVRRAKRGHKKWTTVILQICLKLIHQLLDLQEQGMAVEELISSLPPCIITCGLGALAREVIVESVRMYPQLNITLDGGTWRA